MLEDRVIFLRGERPADEDLAAELDVQEGQESWPFGVPAAGPGSVGDPMKGARPLMEKHHSCLNTRAIIDYFQENLP